jgi:ATP-binding protein involved in chromosome partitioning
MAETLENKVLHALGQVIDHESDQNIVSLGFVKDITIDEGKVNCVLEFNEINQKRNEKIFEDSKKAINEIPGVTKINIVTTYHKDNDDDEDVTLENEKEQEQAENLGTSRIKYIIAVSSAKGGVGKSTVSVNLASAFKHIGLKVCLLDADIYGPSLPKMIGSKDKPESDGKKIETIKKYGLSTMSMGYMVNDENPIIWRGLMVMKAINEMIEKVNWGEADIMIIDMPPGTGDVQLTLTQKLKLTGSVLVSTPQDIALIDVVRGLKMFEKTNVPIYGIIENMSYFIAPDTGKEYQLYGESRTEGVASKYDYEILAKLPHDPLLMEQCEKGHPLTDIFPEHKVSQIFIGMAEDILKRIKLNKLSEIT